MCGSSPTNCTPNCMDLITTTRDQLGCCVNIFNDSTNGLDDRTPFRYSLWSLCGVDQVAEECAPSLIELTQVQTEPTCSHFIETVLRNAACIRTHVESAREELFNAGCENETFFDQLHESCLATESGQYCITIEDTFTLYNVALDNCDNTSVCDPLCVTALTNFNSTAGCCLNSGFNSSTESQRDFLTFEFWSRCGLATPGLCVPLLTDDPTPKPPTDEPTPETVPIPSLPATDGPPASGNHASTVRENTSIAGALCVMALVLTSH